MGLGETADVAGLQAAIRRTSEKTRRMASSYGAAGILQGDLPDHRLPHRLEAHGDVDREHRLVGARVAGAYVPRLRELREESLRHPRLDPFSDALAAVLRDRCRTSLMYHARSEEHTSELQSRL